MVKRAKVILFVVFSFWFLVSGVLGQEIPFPSPEQLISLDFKDVSLKDALKIFSIQSGLNFIASEVVQDRMLTLYFENVPVKDAMDKIFKANNLTYELDPISNIFIVKEWGRPAIETITRVFPLRYARVPTSGLDTEIGRETGMGIINAVALILTEHGKMTEDPRTNSLIITDVPARFKLIEETIARLDISVPQVLIEVEMLDVTKSAIDKMGVKFGAEWLRISGSAVGTTFPLGRRLAKTGETAPPKVFRMGTLSAAGFSAILEFLATQTDTKYLARPRLLTLSNETAEIKMVTQEAIGLEIVEAAAGEEEVGMVARRAERAETGVSLKVTPQVNPETRKITMLIEPKVKEARVGATFDAITFKDPEERGTKSVVRVKDGETIVIGGLLRTEVSTTVIEVPFLADIPLLGALFRHRSIEPDRERELIVFITPHIREEKIMAKVEVKPEILEREQEPLILERKRAIEKTLKSLGRE